MAEVQQGSHGSHGSPRVDDATVPWLTFVGVGGLVAGLGILYWFTAYEDAGTVLLLLSGALALWFGTFLWLQWRARQRRSDATQPVATAPSAGDTPEPYLPHASVWPFLIGLGAATVLNGLVLGTWVLVPGAGLTLIGIGGFIRQTRNRD